MPKKIIVIGSGFAGLSCACFLAKSGYKVSVIEKNSMAGGRAQIFTEQGFTFDMGPSWYWMPDVFERFFALFDKKPSDFYTLSRLNPSYSVFWEDEKMLVPAQYEELKNMFEHYEQGSSKKLDAFLKEAEFKYQVGIQKLVHKPGLSVTEFLDIDLLKGVLKLDVFTSMSKHIRKYFSHPKLIQLLEFPVLFLGALPQNTPALYSLMNYADIVGGTWYPMGGMFKIADAMYQLALSLGVQFSFNEEVEKISVTDNIAESIVSTNTKTKQKTIWQADLVVANADYHHVETNLLDELYRTYDQPYWDKRVMAPSSLLYYVGINKKLQNLNHHNLFFDTSFEQHGKEIYESHQWPKDPLFYACVPSLTDSSVAPAGCENLFILIPVSTELQDDTEAVRERYFEMAISRLEKHTNQSIKNHILFKRSFAHSDFKSVYHSFKGNAYGLANTLMQTAILKPTCKSKKVNNLYFTGQLTVPGPGVPPSLISGEVIAKEIFKQMKP